MTKNIPKVVLFNSAIEAAVHMAVLLEAFHPRTLSAQQLVCLDYMLVHSADFPNGPPSLHLATPIRGSEVILRRTFVTEGIDLLLSVALVHMQASDAGFMYQADESISQFLDAIRTEFGKDLRRRAHWVAEIYGDMPRDKLLEAVLPYIDKWGSEFEEEYLPRKSV